MPDGVKYAVSGAPVIIDGRRATWTDVAQEGFDTSIRRATWHVFVGVKENDNKIYYFAFQTKDGDLWENGEAYNKLSKYGCKDLIKLDGGGSILFRENSEDLIPYIKYPDGSSEGPDGRLINTIVTF